MGGHDNVGKSISGLVLGLSLVLTVFLTGIAQGATTWAPAGAGANTAPGAPAVANSTFTRTQNVPTTCDDMGGHSTGNYVSGSFPTGVGECIDSGGVFLDGLQSLAIGNIGTTHFWYTAWVSDRADGNESQDLVPYAASCYNATNPAFNLSGVTHSATTSTAYSSSGHHGYFLARPLTSAGSTGIPSQAGIFSWETNPSASRGGLSGGMFNSSGSSLGIGRYDAVYVSGVSTGGLNVTGATWVAGGTGNRVQFTTAEAIPAGWGTAPDQEMVVTNVDNGTFLAGTAGTYVNQAATDVSWTYVSKGAFTVTVDVPGVTSGSTAVAGGTIGLLLGGNAAPDGTNGVNNMGYTFNAGIAAPTISATTYSGLPFMVTTVNSAGTVTTDTGVNPTVQGDPNTGFISVWRGYYFYTAGNFPTLDTALHKGYAPADAIDDTTAGAEWKSTSGLSGLYDAWYIDNMSTPSYKISGASWVGGKITYTLATNSNFVATTDTVTVTGASPSGYNVTGATVTDVGPGGSFIKVAAADPGAYNASASAGALAKNVSRTTLLTSPTDTGTAMSSVSEAASAVGWISANLPILSAGVPTPALSARTTNSRVITVTTPSAHGLTSGGAAKLDFGSGSKANGTWVVRDPVTSTTFDVTIDSAQGAESGGIIGKPPYCSAAFASASIDGPVANDTNPALGHAFWTNPISADTGALQSGPTHSDRYAIAAAGNKVYMLTSTTTGYYTTMCTSSPRTMYVNVGTANTQAISTASASGTTTTYTVASSAGMLGKDVVIAGIEGATIASSQERYNGAFRVTGTPTGTTFTVTSAAAAPTAGVRTFTNAVVGWVNWQSTPAQLSTTGAAVSYPAIAANGSTVAAVYSELPQGDVPNTTTQNPPVGLSQNAEVWVALSTDSGATWTRHLAGWTSATYDNWVGSASGCPDVTWSPPSVEGWDSSANVAVNDNYIAVIWNRNNLGKTQAKIGWITTGPNAINWGKSGGGVNNPASCSDSTQIGCNQTLAPAGGKGALGGHSLQDCKSWSATNPYSSGACAVSGGWVAMAGLGDATRIGFTWVNDYRHSKDGYLPSCNNTACTYTTTETGYGGSAFSANWAPGIYYKYWTPLGGWSATRLITCFEALAVGSNTVCSGSPPATAVQMDGWGPSVALFGDLKLAVTSASGSGALVTYTVASSSGIKAGDRVVVAGMTPAGYNGSFTVSTVPTATTFTRVDATTGASTPGTVYRQGSGAGIAWNACAAGAALGCDGGRADARERILFKESGNNTVWSGDLTSSTDCPGMGSAAGSCSVAIVANSDLTQFFCPATGGGAKFAALTKSSDWLVNGTFANPCGTPVSSASGISNINTYPDLLYDSPRTAYVATCPQATTGFFPPAGPTGTPCMRIVGYQGRDSFWAWYRMYLATGTSIAP